MLLIFMKQNEKHMRCAFFKELKVSNRTVSCKRNLIAETGITYDAKLGVVFILLIYFLIPLSHEESS